MPDALVTAVLAAAVRAPSAENAQPWEFVVVREEETKAAIVQAMRDAWDRGAREYAEPRLSPEVFADVETGVRSGLAGAPLLVVVAADTARVHPDAVGASLFPAVQNLLLAATALGLGSALTTLAVTAAPRSPRRSDCPKASCRSRWSPWAIPRARSARAPAPPRRRRPPRALRPPLDPPG